MTDIFIHPTATVDEGATIGAGTNIWHYSHIMPKAIIGDGCNIGQNVFIANNVHIGKGAKIQNNVSVYEGVELEEDVFLGPSMVFTNVDVPRAFIERKHYLSTKVGRGVSIGANATIICGNILGEYAFIGAGAVINTEVKPYGLYVGVPAKIIGWVSKAGRRLTFDDQGKAQCPEFGDAYELVDGKVRAAS